MGDRQDGLSFKDGASSNSIVFHSRSRADLQWTNRKGNSVDRVTNHQYMFDGCSNRVFNISNRVDIRNLGCIHDRRTYE